VRLTEVQRREFGIAVDTAGPGKLQMHIMLPGQVALNADRRAHIVPRISGVVQQMHKNLGDQVRAGEVIAAIERRELAELKSAYLAAKERVSLAETTFRREEDLWKKKISAEQEYLEAKQALVQVRIELRTAEQKLSALGLSNGDLSRMPAQPDTAFTRYAMAAPFDGTVIEKRVTLGEVAKDDAVYVIPDLRSVWVNLSIYVCANGRRHGCDRRPAVKHVIDTRHASHPVPHLRTRGQRQTQVAQLLDPGPRTES
jgi:membrane fusion protein, heavy metal efflux system